MKSAIGAVLCVCSAVAMAQAPSGKWAGSAKPNVGQPSRCPPNMAFELVVENGKLAGTLDFGDRIQPIEATVSADGKFETAFVNPQGHSVQVSGKLDDAFSVVNPIRCGYDGIPLKR